MTTEVAPDPRSAKVQEYSAHALRLAALARQGNKDAFAALVLKDQAGEHVDLAPIHRCWTRFIADTWAEGKYPYILAPWRHGKTVMCTIRYAITELGDNPDSRVRILSADDDEAMKRVAASRRYIESWEYKLVYPHIRPARGAEWTRHSLFVERRSPGLDPSLEAAGVFTGEAGGGNDLIILDDIVTYQNSFLHPTQRKQVYDTLMAVWLRRIDPHTRVLGVGTRWHADDATSLLMAQGGGQWKFLIQRVSEDFKYLDCEVVG